MSTISNRGKALIRSLINDDDVVVTNEEDFIGIVVDFLRNLYKCEGHYVVLNTSNCFRPIPSEFHDILTALPEMEEIHKAIKSMAPSKALGPDGIPAIFFQK